MKEISLPKNNLKKYGWQIVGGVAFAVLLTVDMLHCAEIDSLKAEVAAQIAKKEDVAPTYVYDVKRVVADYAELNTLQQKYTQQLSELNQEVAEAQKKLEKMKDKKAKAEFSEVYLSALTLKRDTLLENYEKSINDLSEKANKALLKVVDENNIPVVYDIKVIAVTTPNVIDITEEVLKTLQQ